MNTSVTGTIFNIQRFSIHDGPGIRTTVFFKGCSLRCLWCHNPEGLHGAPQVISNQYGLKEVIGRQITVAELFSEVMRDKHFFDASKGGVTISGGEPAFQMGFLLQFVSLCRKENVSTALQTSGYFKWEDFEPIARSFDLIQFDIKIIDPINHKLYTGVTNEFILHNARKLAEIDVPIEFRMLIVPTYTDTSRNFEDLLGFLKETGIRKVTFLKYHNLGESKLSSLSFPLKPLQVITNEMVEKSLQRARKYFGHTFQNFETFVDKDMVGDESTY